MGKYNESPGTADPDVDPRRAKEFRRGGKVGHADEFRSTLTLPGTVAGQRLDQALAAALPQYSRSLLARWVRDGNVTVQGKPARARDRMRGGETVTVAAMLARDDGVAAEDLPLDVVFEDAALIVVNKPPGLVVHPGAGNRAHTLQNALLGRAPELTRVPRAGLVHRLDKETSGLLLVARTLEAHTRLVAALAARAIGREYLAVCSGVPTGGGRIEHPIGRHRSQRTRMTVRADGRQAVTHYRVEERFRAHALLRVQLETGRTHQIRVHLAHIGHPVVGDPVYGARRLAAAGASPQLAAVLAGFRRQALHAQRLSCAHPVDGRPLQFEAPAPADMVALIAALRRDAQR
jgi:23S rRNA pseudouridine1911/1915/1917 synthase